MEEKLWKQKQPKVSFALGNSFSKIGYRAYSFHDWTYTYYKRNITMKGPSPSVVSFSRFPQGHNRYCHILF